MHGRGSGHIGPYGPLALDSLSLRLGLSRVIAWQSHANGKWNVWSNKPVSAEAEAFPFHSRMFYSSQLFASLTLWQCHKRRNGP
jgi:hypothetical protein